MKFKESALAHKYLDGMKGIEIGEAAHNPFGLDTINVDLNPQGNVEQMSLCGEIAKVDILAPGDDLPFDDNSYDFVLSSHVIEHFYDPIKALLEWQRVASKYIFMIVPHKERTFDWERPLTSLDELLDRGTVSKYEDKHWSVWILDNFLELMEYLRLDVVATQDPDDKVGNGFTVVCRL